MSDEEEEDYTFPPVDLSCHCCRRHPCECERQLEQLRENSRRLAELDVDNEPMCG